MLEFILTLNKVKHSSQLKIALYVVYYTVYVGEKIKHTIHLLFPQILPSLWFSQ